ncbi:hypothetical protein ACHAQA_006417 [Verticillium albo-atrum]
MSLVQLQRLLPLPEEELKQVLDYGATLSKAEAADHFGNLLGDSPQAVEFISSFNSRRKDTQPVPAPTQTPTRTPDVSSANNSDAPNDGVPRARRGQNKKKKPALHTPAARQVEAFPVPGVSYNKKNQLEDYIGKRPSPAPAAAAAASSSAFKPPPPTTTATPPPQAQRTAAGYLISEGVQKGKPKSNPASRSSTPKPGNATTKVSIAGGTPMAGASTALNDLDAAIRTLEMTTNPTLHDNVNARRCNCVGARHGVQSAAPNCLSCGKVICLKEGLGPCTYCGAPLLSSADVQAMVKELKLERGREKMAADRDSHKRAEVSKKPAPFSQFKAANTADSSQMSEAEAKAKAHRDKLLGFQAQNVQRTTVRDEAADFDVSGAVAGTGGNMWSTPEDRARELKRQQKVLREMEWNARPEYEKRRQIVSIDLVGGRVVKKMAAVERPPTPEAKEEDEDVENYVPRPQGGGGAFSRNPLLGHMIKPVYEPKGKGAELEGRRDRKTQWRRVQDDHKDNEAVILDGGAHGHATTADEPACG